MMTQEEASSAVLDVYATSHEPSLVGGGRGWPGDTSFLSPAYYAAERSLPYLPTHTAPTQRYHPRFFGSAREDILDSAIPDPYGEAG